MSGTIDDLSKSTRQLAEGADGAVAAVQRSREIAETLREAAREISRVSETISKIADQTNLLALNARIEAASAGDAGRGFAVVANEVKELARETVQATGTIDGQVRTMIARSDEVALAVGEIAEVIEGVNSLASTLATALEEQNATTNDIAAATAQVAQGTTSISDGMASVAQTSQGATETARGIHEAAEQLTTLAQPPTASPN
jgi:methyl-accepting chemotaxis protein